MNSNQATSIEIKSLVTTPEVNYIISLLEFRELAIALEHEIFNTMDNLEYELKLLSILKQKCSLVVKDYTK